MLNNKYLVKTLPGVLLLATVSAATAADPWTGKGELGYVLVEGNTKSEVLNVGIEFEKVHDNWKHVAKIGAIDSKSNGVQSADSRAASWRSEYSFSERTFGFGEASYSEDEFDSFDRIYTISFGAGYKVIMEEDQTWNLSAGVGYRDTTVETTGVDIGSIAYVFESDYKHQLTETTSFENLTKILLAEDDNYSTNIAGLSVAINSALALKLKHEVRHHSDPEPGFKSVDRITSVNIVYKF
ncbi:hypothetical protein NBRC116493_18420 [Aurantivibrio infirmus]